MACHSPHRHAARGSPGLDLLVATAAALVAAGCVHAAASSFPVSPALHKGRHHRIAVLVARMGGERLQGVSEIGPGFDYARRAVGEFSVYIDDEARLRESVPTYPTKPCHVASGFNNCTFAETYFANVTPRIVQTIEPLLASKGYAPQDLRVVARDWDRPFSEMNVAEIVAAARPAADAVLFLHYSDVGPRSGKGFDQKGFTLLQFAIALFDTTTGERLVWFSDVVGVLDAMTHDPSLKGRVSTSDFLGKSTTDVTLSPAESATKAMTYLRDGYCADAECRSRKRGLQALIP